MIQQLLEEAQALDMKIISLLRQALILRVRSNSAREAANGLMPASGNHLGDWVKYFGRMVFEFWDRPTSDHVISLESSVAERFPTEFHFKE